MIRSTYEHWDPDDVLYDPEDDDAGHTHVYFHLDLFPEDPEDV